MKHDWISRVRPLTGALTLLLGLTVVAPPASAAETGATRRSLRAATAAKVAALDVTKAVRMQTTDTTAPAATESGRGFFGTGKGKAVLVLMVAGVGYTIYSKDKDRIHSPVRN